MAKVTILRLACIAVLCATWPLGAANRADQKPAQYCPQTVERYFPGDFYFCAGSRAFDNGRYEHALSMYESSAAWGDKRAQFNLGLIYFRGDHVPVNQPLGLAWLALAAERPDSSLEREVLAASYSSVSPEIRRQADALWNTMKVKYADHVALERARTRYDRESRHIEQLKASDPFASVAVRGLGHSPGASQGNGLNFIAPLGSVGGLAKDMEERAARQLDREDGKVIVGELEMTADRPASDSTPKKKVQQARP